VFADIVESDAYGVYSMSLARCSTKLGVESDVYDCLVHSVSFVKIVSLGVDHDSCMVKGLVSLNVRMYSYTTVDVNQIDRCHRCCMLLSTQQVAGERSSDLVGDSVCSRLSTQLRAHHLRHAVTRAARSTADCALLSRRVAERTNG